MQKDNKNVAIHGSSVVIRNTPQKDLFQKQNFRKTFEFLSNRILQRSLKDFKVHLYRACLSLPIMCVVVETLVACS